MKVDKCSSPMKDDRDLSWELSIVEFGSIVPIEEIFINLVFSNAENIVGSTIGGTSETDVLEYGLASVLNFLLAPVECVVKL